MWTPVIVERMNFLSLCRYRSENAGKFPTVQHTKKEVGGGYYVVREIIQELEYKFKMKSQLAKDRSIQDDSQSARLDDKKAVNTGCVLLEEKRGLQTSSSERRLSNEVETISTLVSIDNKQQF
jgi:hypothetical protein